MSPNAPVQAAPPSAAALDEVYLRALGQDLIALREAAEALEGAHGREVAAAAPDNQASARNLLHYLALRGRDIRGLQDRLSRAGLSSLGRAESHVLVSLDRVLGMIRLALGLPPLASEAAPVGFREGPALLATHAAALLGPSPTERSTRIMVTLPTQAGSDVELVRDMVGAGMDVARINLAHDDEPVWTGMVEAVRSVGGRGGLPTRIVMDLAGPKLRTGDVVGPVDSPRVKRGERFLVVSDGVGDAAASTLLHQHDCVAAVRCGVAEVFLDVRAGDPLALDDGKVAGRVVESTSNWIVVDVTRAKRSGVKLKPGRGINLPETGLTLPALSAEDRKHLDFVVEHADAVSLSFVRTEQDVRDVLAELKQRGGRHLGLILKIETVAAFRRLPGILLAALSWPRVGIMIARGDLAVEAGFERLAEVQEELLWIAEAAHLPTVWATQVLESLAKSGLPSRAEITDAAMSGRAECVMLNKGPYIVEAIQALDDILSRMGAHQQKKRTLLRSLQVSERI
ncbi:MAG: pyruvate kinase [Gemmatimonadota bacterium]